jgi:membrane protease YdiL (CAAX protease family)
VRLLVVGVGALSWSEMGIRRPDRAAIGELAYGAALGGPLVFAAGLLALLLSGFLSVPEGPLPEAGGPLGALLNVVTAALIAPVAEEIFFRGFATTAWLRSLGENRAIVRGAIFFAAAHVLTVGGASFGEGAERALFAFLVRLPVAFALGWVFVRRRSLVSAIGLHGAYNAVPVLALLLQGE